MFIYWIDLYIIKKCILEYDLWFNVNGNVEVMFFFSFSYKKKKLECVKAYSCITLMWNKLNDILKLSFASSETVLRMGVWYCITLHIPLSHNFEIPDILSESIVLTVIVFKSHPLSRQL